MDDFELMIDDCLSRNKKLNQWEREFLDSITGRELLTDNQYEKLSEIWERVT